jgi:hypothetical protein
MSNKLEIIGKRELRLARQIVAVGVAALVGTLLLVGWGV